MFNATELYPLIKDDLFEIYSLNKAFGGYSHPDPEGFLMDRIANSEKITKEKNGEVEGFISYLDWDDRLEMMNLAIRKDLRRTFYGSKLAVELVNQVFDIADKRHIPIDAWFLKVEAHIIDYARRMGFSFVDHNYYQQLWRREAK